MKMKKSIGIIVLLFSLSGMVWSEAFHAVGLGFTIPKYKMNLDKTVNNIDYVKSGSGINLEVMYHGVSKPSGITFKTDLSLGKRKVKMANSLPNASADYGTFTLGLGYSFIRTNEKILSLCGVLGWDYMTIDEEYYGGSTKYEETDMAFSVGVALTGIFKLTKHLGVYSSVDIRRVVSGEAEAKSSQKITNSINYVSECSVKGKNGYAVKPAVGLCFRF